MTKIDKNTVAELKKTISEIVIKEEKKEEKILRKMEKNEEALQEKEIELLNKIRSEEDFIKKEEESIKQMQSSIEEKTNEIKEVIQTHQTETKRVYDILGWKQHIWDICKYKITNIKEEEVDFICKQINKPCNYVNCPLIIIHD